MNIIYLERDKLKIVKENQLKNTNLFLFFSSFKHSLVYVEGEYGELKGFVDHNLYKSSNYCLNGCYKIFTKVLVDDSFNTLQVDLFFEMNLNDYSLPVVNSNNHLIGVYVRSLPEELSSKEKVMNTIAMSVIPAFVNELNQFFVLNNIRVLYIIAGVEEYNKILDLFSSYVEIRKYLGQSLDSNSIIIDIQYSKTYRNSINPQILSLEEFLSIVLLPIAINYVRDRNAFIYFVEGPLKERIVDAEKKWPQLFEEKTLVETISDDNLLGIFCDQNEELIKWSRNLNDGIFGGDEVCTNGIHLLMSKKLDLEYETEKQRLYLYGPCFVYGLCVPERYNISTILQEKFPDYYVINNAVKNGHSLLNDILYIMNTNIKAGDVLIDINVFSKNAFEILDKSKCYHDFNEYFNDNVNEKCQFLNNTFHANQYVTYIAAKYVESLIKKISKKRVGITSLSYIQEFNKISRIDTRTIMGKSLMSSYIEYIRGYKRDIAENQIVGSVILTANPLTKGHEYLIKVAKSKCDILYVFIVEEDSFDFTTIERLSIVKSVVKDPNIVILTTGKVMTARYTFPDYYEQSHTTMNVGLKPIAGLHFYLFASIVAPELKIIKRYVGEEIKGSVTDNYNNRLISLLPSYGIDVEVIPRLRDSEGNVISASRVRDMILKQDTMSLTKVLSSKVLNYIKATRYEYLINAGRWSSTYKKGLFLIKRYKYYDVNAVRREALASKAAYSSGIHTPFFLKTVDDRHTLVNIFEYVDIESFKSKNNFINYEEKIQLCRLIGDLSNVIWNKSDSYWYNNLLPEFTNALSYIGVDVRMYLDVLNGLKPEVFIHGDFTFNNMGITKEGNIIIYDFQHGCLGPSCWDKVYLASTMKREECFLDINDYESSIAEIISAIRYGRAIRKNEDVLNRKEIYYSWINQIK